MDFETDGAEGYLCFPGAPVCLSRSFHFSFTVSAGLRSFRRGFAGSSVQFRNISGGDHPKAVGVVKGSLVNRMILPSSRRQDDFIFSSKISPLFPISTPRKGGRWPRFSKDVRHVLLHGVIDEHRLSFFPGKEDAFRHLLMASSAARLVRPSWYWRGRTGKWNSLLTFIEEHEHQV